MTSALAKRRRANASGQAAENRALDYLLEKGLVLVERNYSCQFGEIDLIMRAQKVLVFVEVRKRASANFGGAAASVGVAKQAKLWRTAECYLRRHSALPACRFDLVAIDGDTLEWITNAFGQ